MRMKYWTTILLDSMRDYVYGPWHLWTKKVGAFLLTYCFVSNDEGYLTFR